MTRRGTALVVLVYALAFGVLLPAALWKAARGLDSALGWHAPPCAAGAPVLLAGLALMAAGIAQLAREGAGPPVSALPPPRLARHGPYRYVRHPIYLGFNVALFGAGLWARSAALAWVVAPAFLPVWIAYALVEERVLARRFGARYSRYVRRVGLLPRPPVTTAIRVASMAAWRVETHGAAHVPARGGAVLAANHCCYLDPVFVARLSRRRIHFMATAEAFRHPLLRRVLQAVQAVPVRRYRTDPDACREMRRLLEEGELVGVFVEGERSALGTYAGADATVAGTLARLGTPVIPLALDGSYDCGPRWAEVVRAGRISVRAGPPVKWSDDPQRAIDAALLALLRWNPQPFRWDGLPLERLGRVLWRCPSCFDEPGWDAARLACARCGERYRRLAGGALEDARGHAASLAALGARLFDAAEPVPLRSPVQAAVEEEARGPVRPLVPLGPGLLVADRAGLRFGDLALPWPGLISVSIERADTLQVATRSRMFQFRLLAGSAFRWRAALERWRVEHRRAA